MNERPEAWSVRESARVRAHLESAARAVESAPLGRLSAAQRARRREALRRLRAYIAAGRYPENRVRDEPTPVFVDARGARCAMAALLEATGHHALVGRVAQTANLARVIELAGDGEFAAWLDANGLTVAEAARIQPMYHAYTVVEWQPTVSVIAGAHVGGDPSPGVHVSFSPGLRVGVRRVTRGSDHNGNSHYGSLALTLEYARSFVVDVGSTNQFGLTLHWEPAGNSSDAQWYLLGGPLVAIDENDEPGSGVGGQLGAGFSFRRRRVPFFVEGVAQGLAQGGAVLRAGVQLGVVW